MLSDQPLQMTDQQVVIYQSPALLENSLNFKKDNIQNQTTDSNRDLSISSEEPKTITYQEAMALTEKLYNQKKKEYKQEPLDEKEYTFKPQINNYQIKTQHENQRYKQYALEARQRRRQLEEEKENKNNIKSIKRSVIKQEQKQQSDKQNEQEKNQLSLSQKENQTINIQPISERLAKSVQEYADAAKQSKTNQDKYEEEKIKQELKQCTFKPKINKYKLSTNYSGEHIDRFEKLEKVRQAKMKIQKEKQQQKELEDCTFKPKINENSPWNKALNEPAAERLYAISKKQQVIEEQEDKECTFHPQINDYSQQLLQQRYSHIYLKDQKQQKEEVKQTITDRQQEKQNQQAKEQEQILEQLYGNQQHTEQQKEQNSQQQNIIQEEQENKQQNLFIQIKVRKYFSIIVNKIIQDMNQNNNSMEYILQQLNLSPATNTILNQATEQIKLTQDNTQQFIQRTVPKIQKLNICQPTLYKIQTQNIQRINFHLYLISINLLCDSSRIKQYDKVKCKNNAIIGTLITLYVVSGALKTIVLEYIKLQGAADTHTLLFSIPNTVAMALIIFAPQKQSRLFFVKSMWKQLLIMTVLDLLGTNLTLVGQIYLGSGIYIILYSSMTIWNAFGNAILLKRKFNWIQIVGVIVVFIGLGVSGLACMDSKNFAVGVVFTLVGTIFHSSTYWLNEYFTTNFGVKVMTQVPLVVKNKHKIITTSITDLNSSSMQLMAAFIGIFELPFYLVYELAFTMPHWQQYVLDPVEEAGGQSWEIVVLYISYVLYASIPKLGSVTVGVSKALSTVIVFFFSDWLFCSVESNQCIDWYKVLSLIIVVSGVCFYSYGASKQPSIDKQLNQQRESLLMVQQLEQGQHVEKDLEQDQNAIDQIISTQDEEKSFLS